MSGCENAKNTFVVNLDEAFKAARDYDSRNGITAKPPKGFIFHESRCGSTLAANSLAVASEDFRVYSESAPVPSAVRGGGKNFVRDVIYLMTRGEWRGGRGRQAASEASRVSHLAVNN